MNSMEQGGRAPEVDGTQALTRRGVLACVAVAALASACKSRRVPATGPLRPEDPVDESFRGCQMSTSCGSSTAPEGASVVLQPNAKVGDYTRCVVSGAVFQITEERQRRQYHGRPVYMCCAACARYFDEHADAVAMTRRLSS